MKRLSMILGLYTAILCAGEPFLLEGQEEFCYAKAEHPVLLMTANDKKEKTPPSSPVVSECRRRPSSHLQFGGSYTHARITPYGFNDYNGNLVGAQGLYEFRIFDRIYGGALLRWRQGKETGMLGSMEFTDWNAQQRIGYSFGNPEHLFSLFTGLGFRYLAQQDQPKIGPGVTFDYQEFYVPVGFLYDYKVSSNFSWGLYATWMPQIYPTVTIYPMGGARWILAKTLKNGIVEMPFTISSERFESTSLIIKPFAEYWQDGKTTAISTSGTALNVPKNTYLFVGMDVNLCFSF